MGTPTAAKFGTPAAAKTAAYAGVRFGFGMGNTNSGETSLTNGLHYAHATGIKVVGTDVYISGDEQQVQGQNITTVAIVWKNGFPTNLSNGSFDAYATSLFVK